MTECVADRARRLLAGISPGPWKPQRFYWKHMERVPDQWWIGIDNAAGYLGYLAYLPTSDGEATATADAEFIAAAPDLISALLAENERLRGQVAQIEYWAMKNEVAAVPLDWWGLGDILRPGVSS